MFWNFLSTTVPSTREEVTEVLLKNRKIIDQDLFFSPPNPLDISAEQLGLNIEMLKLAKERILTAIKQQQQILVFGDYDADGVSATAILWQTLYDLGAKVTPFIPHREKHGYGLTSKALAELYQTDLPDLLITVDTGIVANEAVADLQSKGIDVIITDHHQPDQILPNSLAIVHSTKICGAAVAWSLVRELSETQAKNNLDLVALATVTDLMPLKGVNRAFVFHGLKEINNNRRIGLVALREAAGLTTKTITAMHLGFVLGPRINAMGRLSTAMDALRLLCTSNKKRARVLASLVDDTNLDRQQLTNDLYQLAKEQVDQQHDQYLLIVHADDFHEGIIGLIAGRLTEKYAKPSIVISTKGPTAKASARSVPGINITEIIRTARELLLEFGGHPMAAGFGFEQSRLEAVIKHLVTYAKENINPALLKKTLNVECLLPLALVDVALVEAVDQIAPFGQGNDQPVFAFQDVRVTEIKKLGKQQEHLKLGLTDGGDQHDLTVMAWRRADLADKIKLGSLVNLAGILEINEWQGNKAPQLILRDLQLAEVV